MVANKIEFCRPGHVLFPLKRNFSAHMAICQQLKGGVSVIKDSATMDKLSSHIKSFEQCGNSWGKSFNFASYSTCTIHVFFHRGFW